jgi:hypothetical protein
MTPIFDALAARYGIHYAPDVAPLGVIVRARYITTDEALELLCEGERS